MLFGALAFGFMSEIEHRALAQFFVSTVTTAMIPGGVWLLYAIKITNFNRNQLQLGEGRFLYNLQFLSTASRLLLCATVFLLQFSPALLYALYLIKNAVALSTFASIGVIVTCVIICTSFGALALMRNLNRPFREKTVSALKRFLDQHYVRPAGHFYIEWILRKDPVMLFGTKVLTVAILAGICNLYSHEAYDGRLMAMGVTLCGVANAVIAYHLVNYEHSIIGWIKNLPLRKMKRLWQLVVVMGFFLIPEFAVLLGNYPPVLNASGIAADALYLLSIVTFLLGFMHTTAAPLDYFVKRSFWILIVLIVIILFRMPVAFLAAINIISGFILFSKYYYLYEPSPVSQPGR